MALSRPGLGEHLVFGDALHVVDLLGVLLDTRHQLRLVVRLERPAAFTFDAFLHSAPPQSSGPGSLRSLLDTFGECLEDQLLASTSPERWPSSTESNCCVDR